MNNGMCCLCGAPRRPTHAPVESFGNRLPIIHMRDHREVMRHPEIEADPQLLVNVSMWRNGGVDTAGRTHMCDDCILVGLRVAKEWVDASITALSPPDKEARK